MPQQQDETPAVVVAGHVCLDIIPSLGGPLKIEPGRLVRIGPAAVSTGGAVANTGLALHRLGVVGVRLMGKVGDDALGRVILDVLRAHGGPRLADDMIVAPGAATSYSIVVSPPGVDRSFLHCPGANDAFAATDVRYDRLAGAKLFHFGYPPIMRAMYADGGAELVAMLARVRALGLVTSLDLAQPDPASEAGRLDWAHLLARVLPAVDVFLPSVEELLFMLDRPAFDRLGAGEPLAAVADGARVRALGGRLIEMGVAVAVLKLGERGLYVRTAGDAGRLGPLCDRLGLDVAAWRGREVYSPCFAARAVAGTTGSGDCTIAGFLAALLRGAADPNAAATAANAVGACSVEAADATGGVPPWPAVARRLAAGWPRLASAPPMAWGEDAAAVPCADGTFDVFAR